MSELVFVVPFEPPTTATQVRIEDPIQVVAETLTLHSFRPPDTDHLLYRPEQWSWQHLRDYTVGQIITVHGVFPRNDKKEMGIFKGFCGRWGDDAPPIAKFAFEAMGGYWKNAPISVNRFCKASDPYFACLIVDHLNRNVR